MLQHKIFFTTLTLINHPCLTGRCNGFNGFIGLLNQSKSIIAFYLDYYLYKDIFFYYSCSNRQTHSATNRPSSANNERRNGEIIHFEDQEINALDRVRCYPPVATRISHFKRIKSSIKKRVIHDARWISAELRFSDSRVLREISLYMRMALLFH